MRETDIQTYESSGSAFLCFANDVWQRQVKILAKQNLIAICKAQKVSSFPSIRLLLWINDNVWQGKQHRSFLILSAIRCHMRMTLTQLPVSPLPLQLAGCQRMRLESLHMRRPQHCQLASLPSLLLARTACVSRFVCSRSLSLSLSEPDLI